MQCGSERKNSEKPVPETFFRIEKCAPCSEYTVFLFTFSGLLLQRRHELLDCRMLLTCFCWSWNILMIRTHTPSSLFVCCSVDDLVGELLLFWVSSEMSISENDTITNRHKSAFSHICIYTHPDLITEHNMFHTCVIIMSSSCYFLILLIANFRLGCLCAWCDCPGKVRRITLVEFWTLWVWELYSPHTLKFMHVKTSLAGWQMIQVQASTHERHTLSIIRSYAWPN